MNLTGLVNNAADEAADFGRRRVGHCCHMMPVVISQEFVVGGILLFLIFIGSSLLFLVLLSIKMAR